MPATRKNKNPDSLYMFLFFKADRRLWSNPSIIQKILNERKIAGLIDDDKDDEDEDEDEIDEDSEEEF